jgi:hypothetical protein
VAKTVDGPSTVLSNAYIKTVRRVVRTSDVDHTGPWCNTRTRDKFYFRMARRNDSYRQLIKRSPNVEQTLRFILTSNFFYPNLESSGTFTTSARSERVRTQGVDFTCQRGYKQDVNASPLPIESQVPLEKEKAASRNVAAKWRNCSARRRRCPIKEKSCNWTGQTSNVELHLSAADDCPCRSSSRQPYCWKLLFVGKIICAARSTSKQWHCIKQNVRSFFSFLSVLQAETPAWPRTQEARIISLNQFRNFWPTVLYRVSHANVSCINSYFKLNSYTASFAQNPELTQWYRIKYVRKILFGIGRSLTFQLFLNILYLYFLYIIMIIIIIIKKPRQHGIQNNRPKRLQRDALRFHCKTHPPNVVLYLKICTWI